MHGETCDALASLNAMPVPTYGKTGSATYERGAPRYMVYSCAKSSTERGERASRKVRRCRLYTISIPGLTVPLPKTSYTLRNRSRNNAKVYYLIYSRARVKNR